MHSAKIHLKTFISLFLTHFSVTYGPAADIFYMYFYNLFWAWFMSKRFGGFARNLVDQSFNKMILYKKFCPLAHQWILVLTSALLRELSVNMNRLNIDYQPMMISAVTYFDDVACSIISVCVCKLLLKHLCMLIKHFTHVCICVGFRQYLLSMLSV